MTGEGGVDEGAIFWGAVFPVAAMAVADMSVCKHIARMMAIFMENPFKFNKDRVGSICIYQDDWKSQCKHVSIVTG